MGSVQKGIFIFKDNLLDIDDAKLPMELVLSDRVSTEAVLIRLLCGTLGITYSITEDQIVVEQKRKYSLPWIVQNNR